MKDINKKRIGVLMGGPSCERDISIKSGTSVVEALKSKGIDVIPIELGASSRVNGYKKMVEDTVSLSKPDIVFIALHGEFGEDGKVQKILESMNIPYTGSKVNASILGMDKIKSKEVFRSGNIPTPKYIVINKNKSNYDIKSFFKTLGDKLVIKPTNEGSSVGLSIVE